MYICICNAITERDIRGALDLGCQTVEQLQSELGVASCCGKCRDDAAKLVKRCSQHGSPAFAGGDD